MFGMAVAVVLGLLKKMPLVILLMTVIFQETPSEGDVFVGNVTEVTPYENDGTEVIQNTSRIYSTYAAEVTDTKSSVTLLIDKNISEFLNISGEFGNDYTENTSTMFNKEGIVTTLPTEKEDFTFDKSTAGNLDVNTNLPSTTEDLQYEKFPVSENPNKELTADYATDFWTDFTGVPYDKQEFEDSSPVLSSTTSSILAHNFQISNNKAESELQSNEESITRKPNHPILNRGIVQRKLFSLDLKLADDDFYEGENFKSPCDQLSEEATTSLGSTSKSGHRKRSSRQIFEELDEATESSNVEPHPHFGKRARRMNRRNTQRAPVQEITVHTDQANVGFAESEDDGFSSISELINMTAVKKILKAQAHSEQHMRPIQLDAHNHKKHRNDVRTNIKKDPKVEYSFDAVDNTEKSLPLKEHAFPLMADDVEPDAARSLGREVAKRKRDWCATAIMNLTVAHEGCKSKVVKSTYCEGQCKSFYIPQKAVPWDGGRTHASNPLAKVASSEPAFRSCGACAPFVVSFRYVTLKCPHRKPNRQPMRVVRIKRCRCVAATCN